MLKLISLWCIHSLYYKCMRRAWASSISSGGSGPPMSVVVSAIFFAGVCGGTSLKVKDTNRLGRGCWPNYFWTFRAASATEWSNLAATRNDTGCCSPPAQTNVSTLVIRHYTLYLVKSFTLTFSYLHETAVSVNIGRFLQLPITCILFYIYFYVILL